MQYLVLGAELKDKVPQDGSVGISDFIAWDLYQALKKAYDNPPYPANYWREHIGTAAGELVRLFGEAFGWEVRDDTRTIFKF
jgi:hypothetical protein